MNILGKTVRHPVTELDTFQAPAGVTDVTFTCSEVTSVCPVTSQPDFETVTITYVPDQLCIESKSLKLYLWQFREQGVFCETFAVTIRDAIVQAAHPTWVRVIVEQSPRGGIAIRATSTYVSPPAGLDGYVHD